MTSSSLASVQQEVGVYLDTYCQQCLLEVIYFGKYLGNVNQRIDLPFKMALFLEKKIISLVFNSVLYPNDIKVGYRTT